MSKRGKLFSDYMKEQFKKDPQLKERLARLRRWSDFYKLNQAALNTDTELYREGGGDGNGMSYYEPSVHLTKQGLIGMNVGGNVIELPIKRWHEIAKTVLDLNHPPKE